MPPRTANSGSGAAGDAERCPARGRAAARRGREIRSLMTATCAIVNDSIAPKAYMLPRKAAWPGIIVTQAIAPKSRIPIHGVP